MSLLQLDVVTIGCTTLTILGGFATFVSRKPVTLGSVIMIIILAASTTQAILGFMRVMGGTAAPVPEPAAKEEDVVGLFELALSSLTSRQN